MAVLRLDIDGQWSATEFAGILMDLQQLYAFIYVLNDLQEKLRPSNFAIENTPGHLQTIPKLLISKSLYSFVDPIELEMRIVKVQYGSKGFTDLLGAGKIIETLKDLLLKLIELRSNREEREQKVVAMRIENARSMVALAKEIGYSEKEIQGMARWVDARQRNILDLVSEGKLLQVSTPENPEAKPKTDPLFPEDRKFR